LVSDGYLKRRVKVAVAKVYAYRSTCFRLADILDIGKATDYGLAMGIHTRDMDKALLYARGI
jgi:acyl-CoA reductase-like NAD-dependent aldehyde dehydrogenase